MAILKGGEMDREILFRSKNLDEKWIKGFVYHVNTQTSKAGWFIFDGIKPNEVIAETIGQYTCREDKNGAKIFEGDIVKYDNMEAKVVFYKGCFGFVYFGFTAFTQFDSKKVEIIGNIHDGKLKEAR